MNKKLLLLTPVLSMLLVCSVFAFDFNIKGDSKVNVGVEEYDVKVNLWHDDLGAVKGQGDLKLDSRNLKYNLDLYEDNILFQGNLAYVWLTAKGSMKSNNLPKQQVSFNIFGIYDRSKDTLTISSLVIPVKQPMSKSYKIK